MWMMGYNDGGQFSVSDSINGPKVSPLIPKPATATSTRNTATINSPCFGRIHGSDLLAWNHHLATMDEQNKRECNTQQVVLSSRWNPTPEQLQTLEELYRMGTRTPSAEKIQHITAQLRRYGKIEGKNVFYWFQNHKARERQKRRRQLESASHEQYCDINESIEMKESGANRTRLEVEQTKNWAHPANSSTLAEKTVPIQRAAKAAVAECRTDGWLQFDARELQHTRSLVERNGTWQMMQSSCSHPTHLINTSTAATSTTPATVTTMYPKFIKNQDLNIFIAPYREDLNRLVSVGHADEACYRVGESKTLQLFPLRTGEGNQDVGEKETEVSITAMNDNFTPYQFFEFLPLKN
ncbi:hypothetical protein F0562_023972 [Nyssa sinensis]|uniref:Homeobox domain-containing protein n=1 Tax=Nyssa sinensis TaxID=561372 RepID=A0A5J5BKP8_9ASTE|nr:hypothetical protein F0562_023972 [Nyssa sinensis]